MCPPYAPQLEGHDQAFVAAARGGAYDGGFSKPILKGDP